MVCIKLFLNLHLSRYFRKSFFFTLKPLATFILSFQFMEKIQLDFDQLAKDNEVYVVSACGVDSIPADLGIMHLKKVFEGEKSFNI